MYCSECGNKISDNSKFCSYCGTKIERGIFNDEVPQNISMDDIKKYKHDVREGILVYLYDILSMEFSINKLQNEIDSIKSTMSIYTFWFYTKFYKLNHPIKQNSCWGDFTILGLSYSHRLNKYYWNIYEANDDLNYVDYNDNFVNHKYGKISDGAPMDREKRNRLCTVPVFKKRGFFSDPLLTNCDSLYWSRGIAYTNIDNFGPMSRFSTS